MQPVAVPSQASGCFFGYANPYCTCIFHERSNKGEVCLLLDRDRTNIKVSSQEAEGSVGFRTCVVDVGVPFQVFSNGHS